MADLRRFTVAIVSETYSPEVNGVAMTLGRLADGLVARGHRVRIVRPRQRHERCGCSGDQLLTPGLPIPRYPQLRFGLPAVARLRSAWLQQLPDIIHVATEGPLGLSALVAARQLGLPVVSTFHTNFHSYSRHYGLGWLHGGIAAYLRWFHNRTAVTLVPTTALAGDLTRQGYDSVDVLARGVDTRLFSPERRSMALRQDWGAGPNDLVCLVVGRLAPEKNLELALSAFAALRADQPHVRLVCVGDGPLQGQLSRRHPDCLFVGAKYGEELAAHYASADLFLFPSLTETFGNVVSEALASGLPVLSFDQAAASSLVRDGFNGLLVAPGDMAAFIAAGRKLAGTLALRPEVRNACRDSVRHLGWDRIHDSYAAVLAATLDRHERRHASDELVRCVPD